MVERVWPRATTMEEWDSEDGHCWSLELSTYKHKPSNCIQAIYYQILVVFW
jgi:hypothetical protein